MTCVFIAEAQGHRTIPGGDQVDARSEWLGGADDGNLRGWAISLVTIVVAGLLIAAIAGWASRPTPVALQEET